MSTRAKLILTLTGIFLLGCGTGAIVATGFAKRAIAERMAAGSPVENFERRQLGILRQLDLTPEQSKEIMRVLRSEGARLRELQSTFRDKTREHRREIEARLSRILTEEQNTKLRQLKKELGEDIRKRLDQRGGRSGLHPQGPMENPPGPDGDGPMPPPPEN